LAAIVAQRFLSFKGNNAGAQATSHSTLNCYTGKYYSCLHRSLGASHCNLQNYRGEQESFSSVITGYVGTGFRGLRGVRRRTRCILPYAHRERGESTEAGGLGAEHKSGHRGGPGPGAKGHCGKDEDLAENHRQPNVPY
ncbi:hypothetical protein MATL_G00166660, partial [Megalops atlanticus]